MSALDQIAFYQNRRDEVTYIISYKLVALPRATQNDGGEFLFLQLRCKNKNSPIIK